MWCQHMCITFWRIWDTFSEKNFFGNLGLRGPPGGGFLKIEIFFSVCRDPLALRSGQDKLVFQIHSANFLLIFMHFFEKKLFFAIFAKLGPWVGGGFRTWKSKGHYKCQFTLVFVDKPVTWTVSFIFLQTWAYFSQKNIFFDVFRHFWPLGGRVFEIWHKIEPVTRVIFHQVKASQKDMFQHTFWWDLATFMAFWKKTNFECDFVKTAPLEGSSVCRWGQFFKSPAENLHLFARCRNGVPRPFQPSKLNRRDMFGQKNNFGRNRVFVGLSGAFFGQKFWNRQKFKIPKTCCGCKNSLFEPFYGTCGY